MGDDRQMLRINWKARRLGEAQDHQVVGCLGGRQVLEHDAPEILQRLPDVERRERHVGGGEGLAVVPLVVTPSRSLNVADETVLLKVLRPTGGSGSSPSCSSM